MTNCLVIKKFKDNRPTEAVVLSFISIPRLGDYISVESKNFSGTVIDVSYFFNEKDKLSIHVRLD
jgi:hypothetical protein